ncbi:MAG: DUF58 domain-containing protein [Bacteroidota bacterium]
MDTTELLKRVRKIEIKTKGLSKHIFSGEYHSAFKGRGMSFSEVRDYQYGDDVRNIDWNVTARTGDPHVKVFEEERELTVVLLVDVSKSAFFGTSNQFKNEFMTELAAVISFSAANNNDKVGLILFSDKVEKYIPPKKGKTHILRIIRELINFKANSNGTEIKTCLEYLNNVIKKRAICFLLSDFLSTGYEDALRIASKRHDIIGMRVNDPAEMELPKVGLMRVKDAESGKEKIIDTSSKKVRQAYENWYKNHFDYFKNTFYKSGADIIHLKTNESYVNHLINFLKKRSR